MRRCSHEAVMGRFRGRLIETLGRESLGLEPLSRQPVGHQSERGSAVVEFTFLALLLMVPLVYFIITVSQIQGGSFAVVGAADQAAKVYIPSLMQPRRRLPLNRPWRSHSRTSDIPRKGRVWAHHAIRQIARLPEAPSR